ncbi:transcriptional regulator [Mucilaginibacter sp. Bleaf8]|uniref:triple tyrosine motif-containing protein n=1 Tax=Mucilaginibacter sp. Bleaf8 TaxID=2834430 RepID=UPI001BCE7B95|nr:triple tyrosine motif-containing protein [Mucilaginibacter sp. Bleaf8]MBS7565743.1 transcriptional regulator [Mucilaginibacter sp. Bleaf8]
MCRPFIVALLHILFIAQLSVAQGLSLGVPYIQNFPKAIYNSGNQNWSVTQSANGLMYYGNAEGLLVYDGRNWRQYAMPNRQIVRAVATDSSGRIYAGGFGEFGYWAYQNNRPTYTSLTKLLPRNYKLTDEIWKIYVDGGRVLFQSFSNIYIYQHNKIHIVSPGTSMLFLHQAGRRFFAEVLNKGLYELTGNKLTLLPGSEKIQGVLSVLPYWQHSFIIGTNTGGLYLYNGQTFAPFKTPASEFLKAYQLNNGVKVLNKYYAYGTILNGLIITDASGRIIQHINKAKGLQNNTVLSLYADNNQNLWAGLDNGIDRVELNSPLYFNLDKTGQFGTVYSSIIHNNKIYLGTNHGLYYTTWPQQSSNAFDFKMVPASQGQVWDLTVLNGQLLCGHNNGTFRVVDDRMEKISPLSGGWTTKPLKTNPNYLIQGNYNGLALFNKDARGNWQLVNQITGFKEPSKLVEQDEKGNLWVSHAYKGLNRLTLSADFKRVVAARSFDDKNGLPGNFNINVFNLENRIVFSSDSGFYTYDDISNRFSRYESLNKKLGAFATSNRIINAGEHLYWFINHGKVALVDFSQPGKVAVDYTTFSILDGRMVQYYENISRISNSIYLISIDDGFVIYDIANKGHYNTLHQAPSVHIRKIDDITDRYKNIGENENINTAVYLANNRNNIRISYTLPYYRQAQIRFQYYLEGYSNQWSDWSTATQKDFTNLSAGTYVFKVRAQINHSVVSKITSFEFTVQPPWYARKRTMVLYLVFIAIILFVGKKIYERKLKRDHQKIAARLAQAQEEQRKQEAEASEREIAKLQNEKLQAELDSKNRELANSAMSLAYKNELLQKLSDELMKIKDENGKKLPTDQISRVQKVINEGRNDERDWNLFEKSFNEAHENFFKRLKGQHPELVPNDLKLCAYLRMNMSSKELSSLLNISLRGVEIRRYRLRKKLNIPHDKNLVEFLIEL